jgi:surfeit locus 1 family protein
VSGPGTRPRLLVPTLIALAAIGLASALGAWQLQRKTWKEGLIAALTERLAVPPQALPPARTWPELEPASDEYRRVSFTALFDNAKEALVFASASAFRPDVTDSGPGYWVFTPARLADGGVVMVNRGFVPQDRADPATRHGGTIAGPVAMTGTLRWPDARSFFSPADEPAHNLWFLRDPAAIAAAKGLKDVAPFYVEQEAPMPPGGLPQPGKLDVRLRNEHLQYVVTWYGLALVLAVIFVLWALKTGRDPRRADGRQARDGTPPSL